MKHKQTDAVERKPYNTPKLTCYGRIVNLTQSGSGMKPESYSVNPMNGMVNSKCGTMVQFSGQCP